MGSGMRFLALLTLFGAASAGSLDEVALVQKQVSAGSLESAVTDTEGLAKAITQIAMNHSRSSVFKDPKKRGFVTRMMSRLGVLAASAGKAGEKAAVQAVTKEILQACALGPGFDLFDYGLNLPNLLARLSNCDADDAHCQTRSTLELVGKSMDVFVMLANLEQDCGKPFGEQFQDCVSNADGYLYPPKDKNFVSFVTEVIAWAAMATAGIMEADFVCRADESNQDATTLNIPFFSLKPIEPLWLIPTGAAKWFFSLRSLKQLYDYPGPPKAGTLEFCEGASALVTKSLDLLRNVLETVAHEKHEDDPTGGVGELCAAEIFQASTSLPDITERYCAYKSCDEGTFPKAIFQAWKSQQPLLSFR